MNQSTNKKKTTSNVETRMLFARYVEGGLPSVFRLQNLKTKFPFLYFFFAAVGNGRNEKQFTEKKKKKGLNHQFGKRAHQTHQWENTNSVGQKKKKEEKKKKSFFFGKKKKWFCAQVRNVSTRRTKKAEENSVERKKK